MKYFLKILLVLVLAVGTVTGVYYYTTGQNPIGDQLNGIHETTVTKQPATEKNAYKTLLTSLDDYSLYKSGSTIILEHGGKEYEFQNWSSVIAEEEPTMYLLNLDDDEEMELIVRGVSGEDPQTHEYVYDLYILNPYTDSDGYAVTLASQDTWRAILNDYIIEEISQLKNCKKIIQFAMASYDETIAYDTATGIAIDAHAGYCRALQDKNGNYMTVATWGKRKGMYEIKDGKICVEVEINITYNESADVQQAGTIYFELSINNENKISVTPKSMYFNANKDYAVSDPTVVGETFKYTENNASTSAESGEIDYIKYTIKPEASTITQTVNFASQTSDIKKVASVMLTNKGVVLQAKNGCTFSKETAESPDFSVWINKDSNSTYDIAYTVVLDETQKVLTISFDRSYSRSEMETIEINFGAK